MEYGIARAVVGDVNEALAFLADRDGVRFSGQPMVLEPSWSEHMVSWLSSPAVMGVLVMLALLGVYIEFSAPGFGLPGIVAIVCFALMLGSKYLIGMANWVEIAILFIGIVLLLIELFVLPGLRGRGNPGDRADPRGVLRHADPQRSGRVSLAQDSGGLERAVVRCALADARLRRVSSCWRGFYRGICRNSGS